MKGFFADLEARGLIYQLTHPDAFSELLDTPGRTVYIGFDPTADSLHVGSLVPLVLLARLQRAGHRAIALLGGGTGLIGDPSGKSAERTLLSKDQLEHNVAGIREQVGRILDLDGSSGLLLDNSSWLCTFPLTDFLRDVGKHFSVNMMLEKESVKSRLQDPSRGISFTEFSYMLLQSYDFLHLFTHYGCTMQAGGSDQWGNITAGIDLIRRARGGEAFGFTMPLVTKADGTKFGKSESGNVWLSPAYTSPYEFYQFFVRTDDRDVGRFLRMMTFVPVEEIEQLEALVETRPEAREAQKRLAWEVTAMVHGEDEANRAVRASRVLFGGSLEELDERTLLAIFADAPSTELSRGRLEGDGMPLAELLVETGLSRSRGMARKDAKGGGIYVNNVRTPDRLVGLDDLILGRYLVLRKGKKNYHLIKVV